MRPLDPQYTLQAPPALAPGWPRRQRRPVRAAHGTRSRYNYHRCRCLPCRLANAAYNRERYLRRAQASHGRP